MCEWLINSRLLPAADNVVLYKWLLGGGIVVMAILGLAFFAILALAVLRQEDKPAESVEEDAHSEPTAVQPAAVSAEEPDTSPISEQEES